MLEVGAFQKYASKLCLLLLLSLLFVMIALRHPGPLLRAKLLHCFCVGLDCLPSVGFITASF